LRKIKIPEESAYKSNFSRYFENANAERVTQATPARQVGDPVKYISIFIIKPLNLCSTLSMKCVKAYAAILRMSYTARNRLK